MTLFHVTLILSVRRSVFNKTIANIYPGNNVKSLFPRRELYCRDYEIIIK